METARSRFLRYVTYYTTSDEHTGASPSTERQKDLGRVLLAELTALGLTAGRMDSAGNVIATLPASPGVTAPVVALIAHMDTAPDAPGENVKPPRRPGRGRRPAPVRHGLPDGGTVSRPVRPRR